jgi:nicotinamidase-related amidase
MLTVLDRTDPMKEKYRETASMIVENMAKTLKVTSALKGLGRKKIIITGMETHVCVFQTVRDLLAKG